MAMETGKRAHRPARAGPGGAGADAPALGPLAKLPKRGHKRGHEGATRKESRGGVGEEVKVGWTETIAIPSGEHAKPTLVCLLFPDAKRMRVDPAGHNAWFIRLT